MESYSQDYGRKNSGPRLLCVFIVDTSASMSNENLCTLNDMFCTFRDDIIHIGLGNTVLDIAMLFQNSKKQTLLGPVIDEEFVDLKLPAITLEGVFEAGCGFAKAIEIVKERRAFYKELRVCYRRSWILMITNGYHFEAGDYAAQIKKDCEEKRYFFQPIVYDDLTSPEEMERIDSLTTGQTIRVSDIKQFHIARLFDYESGLISSMRLSKQYLKEVGYTKELEYIEKGFPQEDYYSHLCFDGIPPFYDEFDPVVEQSDLDWTGLFYK